MTFAEYRERSSQRGWKFNIVIDNRFLNIEYIHPLKQGLVSQIVEHAKGCDYIDEIRVFGSSITNKCDFQSDLDICIKWNIDCIDRDGVFVPKVAEFLNCISIITEGNCDVVHYDYLDGTIIKQAAQEGVLVYVHDGE